jgi:hypothetical protein
MPHNAPSAFLAESKANAQLVAQGHSVAPPFHYCTEMETIFDNCSVVARNTVRHSPD